MSRLEVRLVLPGCVGFVVEVVSCPELGRLWLLVVDREEDFSSDPCSRDERVSLGDLVGLDSNRTEPGVTFDPEVRLDLELRLLVV